MSSSQRSFAGYVIVLECRTWSCRPTTGAHAKWSAPSRPEDSVTLKPLGDVTRLRDHLLGMLERADSEADPEDDTTCSASVVVGGGFAGMEMLAEFFDLVHGVLPPPVPQGQDLWRGVGRGGAAILVDNSASILGGVKTWGLRVALTMGRPPARPARWLVIAECARRN